MKKSSSYQNEQISQEACEWCLLIDERSMTKEERKAFAFWIRQSPIHIKEFILAHSILTSVENSQCSLPEDIVGLIPNNVTEIGGIQPKPRSLDRLGKRLLDSIKGPLVGIGVIASLASVLLLIMGSLFDDGIPANEYTTFYPAKVSTVVGEDELLRLPDGSLIHLNTDTQLEYVVNEAVRRVKLISGEAFFEIAKDSTRPFVIQVENTLVRVVGTAFNINSILGSATIEVSEGVVTTSIIPKERMVDDEWLFSDSHTFPVSGMTKKLQRGDKTAIDKQKDVFVVTRFDHKHIASWRRNELIFTDTSIAEIITQYNRYNNTQLVIADSTLGKRRLSGVFDSRDPESFVEYLQHTQNAKVTKGIRTISITQ